MYQPSVPPEGLKLCLGRVETDRGLELRFWSGIFFKRVIQYSLHPPPLLADIVPLPCLTKHG
ncbi:hypothetical protein BgiBS90_035598, partial [Biomphalaria glabrata]